MDTQRLILLFIFGFSLLLLWEEWQKEHRPAVPTTAVTPSTGVPKPSGKPMAPTPQAPAPAAAGVSHAPASGPGQIVRVRTDLFSAEIDTAGGTLARVEFFEHKDSKDEKKGFVLLGPEQ